MLRTCFWIDGSARLEADVNRRPQRRQGGSVLRKVSGDGTEVALSVGRPFRRSLPACHLSVGNLISDPAMDRRSGIRELLRGFSWWYHGPDMTRHGTLRRSQGLGPRFRLSANVWDGWCHKSNVSDSGPAYVSSPIRHVGDRLRPPGWDDSDASSS
jgi:hypothetical protein